jgi:hypothetical protein
MKKWSKIISFFMAVIMISAIMPISAFAADALSKAVNVVTNSDYYNVSLTNTGGDYINFEYTGVNKDGTMTVNENEDITVVMNMGNNFNSSSNSTELGWHYGGNTQYQLATDYTFTMTDNTYNFTASGFNNGSTVFAGNSNSTSTTFTLAGGLPAGQYTFTVKYKYQMKKWKNTSYKANYELTSSDDITINVVSASEPEVEYSTTAVGGSIKVPTTVDSSVGLRFGFKTDVKAELVEERGFLFAAGSLDEINESTQNVKKLEAANYIVHNEGTEDEYTTFNLVFVNIPKANYESNITACSYVVVDGKTYYSEAKTYNFKAIADKVIATEDSESEIVKTLQGLLNA